MLLLSFLIPFPHKPARALAWACLAMELTKQGQRLKTGFSPCPKWGVRVNATFSKNETGLVAPDPLLRSKNAGLQVKTFCRESIPGAACFTEKRLDIKLHGAGAEKQGVLLPSRRAENFAGRHARPLSRSHVKNAIWTTSRVGYDFRHVIPLAVRAGVALKPCLSSIVFLIITCQKN